ncbi:SufD family Fe-S cluster assembly protein [Kordiimonas gwangyangensis]|uniref:SufD family Fe-S cluster assembly protein n=1 Tax=Kordiimonas gwangyangensis TaxID=288022 RepID=UPI003F70FBEA
MFADDVKCSHGATIGELDAKAIFYLTSRGIDPVTARRMLVEAFTAGALERVTVDSIRDAMMERIGTWMSSRADRTVAEVQEA